MVHPMGNHRASAPVESTSPATPRNEAADRYSPPIAELFSTGLTDREAT